MIQGKFITLEGGEGVGKTTNIQFVADYLERQGKDVVLTREPGGTEAGESIRAILLDTKQKTLYDSTELLLIFAARVQHVQQCILPSLEAGKWVVSDRFIDATYAYQGGGRGMDQERIKQLQLWCSPLPRPDLTLLLDADIKVGAARAQSRGKLDRFELEKAEFFTKVRQAYVNLAVESPDRIKIVNAALDLASVQEEIEIHLTVLLND
ncbi:MAG: dTMP kinase [Methylococcales bacterium]